MKTKKEKQPNPDTSVKKGEKKLSQILKELPYKNDRVGQTFIMRSSSGLKENLPSSERETQQKNQNFDLIKQAIQDLLSRLRNHFKIWK